MNLGELNKHLQRIDRGVKRAGKHEGKGYSYSVSRKNEESIRYIFNGVPHIDEVEDQVRHALIDLWSLRDYVKHTLKSQGKDSSSIWGRIKSCSYIPISADLANVAKHGKLVKPPHGSFEPKFGGSVYSLHIKRDPISHRLIGSGIERIIFRQNEVEIDTMNQNDPNYVSFKLPVLDQNDYHMEEACNVLVHAYEEWKQLLWGLGIDWIRKEETTV